MIASLRDEIRQTRPFESLQQEAFLNLCRTAVALEASFDALLKKHNVSLPQFNVLRILRGAGASGLGRNGIRDRLVTRMPDVTRMLDRLERLGLIRRERSADDRRQVATFLTAAGESLLTRLDAPVAAEHQRQLRHLSTAQLRALIELTTLARTEV
jgi:DNA-binding MarR family transcriptional regulator